MTSKIRTSSILSRQLSFVAIKIANITSITTCKFVILPALHAPELSNHSWAACSKIERMRCASVDTRHFKFEISGKTDTSKESKRLKIGFRIINEMWLYRFEKEAGVRRVTILRNGVYTALGFVGGSQGAGWSTCTANGHSSACTANFRRDVHIPCR